jgi:hypothetical protein
MSSELVPEGIKLFSQPGTGKVERMISSTQPGRVEFQATYWPARLYHPEHEVTLVPDDPVTVVGRQGITLLVVPVSEVQESDSQEGAVEQRKAIASHISGWTQKIRSVFALAHK